MEFILKAIIGGLIVAGVVTAAQRGNPTLGALILGIPLGSVISLIFMYYSGVDVKVFQQLAKSGIVVRKMDAYGIKNSLRITIGKSKENRELISILKKILNV